MTIHRLLVANRGEIARRVFATCRTLGIETVAVYSDADAGLPFVAEADAAVSLAGSTPADTYLRGDLMVAAAKKSGADAIHPGYGFLSENADFAREVIEAGLVWVGPTPDSLESMGSKVTAKKLMADAGVPVLEELSPASLTEDDLPVLVKASAGGGGRGMRIVRRIDEVASAVEMAAAEAASAFGDATVFCEPYVEHGRHVEVQIVGDTHGNAWVLGERDCSIQRRHQKVIEETPAPGLSGETRASFHQAARSAAEVIGYVGAGTVEFLLDSAGTFYFLEMNTRLQVEHPVTECVTGLDLVALQIAVAEGEVVGGDENGATAPRPNGHAVEARLYAEDPASDWAPQSGRLTRFEVPGVSARFANPASYGVRLDSGFTAGDEIGTHYDAMLAKVIAWAPTREQALRRLSATLANAKIHGVRTNRDLLVNVLRHEAVMAGDISTDFFERHGLRALASPPADAAAVRLSALAATVALAEAAKSARKEQARIPVGWRNVTSQPLSTKFVVAGEELVVGWYGGRDGYRAADGAADRDDVDANMGVRVVTVASGSVVLEVAGVSRTFEVTADGNQVDVESSLGHVALRAMPRFVDPAQQVASGSLLAPMPGTVISVAVGKDDEVTTGQTVLVLEAMKMQHTVSAPHDGVVADVLVAVGDHVTGGAVLAVVHAPEPDQQANPPEEANAGEGETR